MSAKYLDIFNEKVDLIQIGARNMQNFDLFKELGQVDRPILLKRGLKPTYEEWIMSAEYIMASGNENVILCERGIRTFESYTRNTLDLQSIPVLRRKTHLPIVVDPSHAGGKWWLVDSMAMAAVAAGADGLMIEVHNDPESALCDGAQSLKPKKYDELIQKGFTDCRCCRQDDLMQITCHWQFLTNAWRFRQKPYRSIYYETYS